MPELAAFTENPYFSVYTRMNAGGISQRIF
jgi:hypothetical protein